MALLGDISGCWNVGGVCSQHPVGRGQGHCQTFPLKKNYSASEVNSGKVEKPRGCHCSVPTSRAPASFLFLRAPDVLHAHDIQAKATNLERVPAGEHSNGLLCLCLNWPAGWPVNALCSPSVSPEMSFNCLSRRISVLFGRKGEVPVKSHGELLTSRSPGRASQPSVFSKRPVIRLDSSP